MNYEKQAQDFLDLTNTSFNVVFKEHGKHFDTDTDTRDIYTMTLGRGSRSFTFDFGQSITNSGFYAAYSKQKISLDRSLLDLSDAKLKTHIRMNTKAKDFGSVKADKIHRPTEPTAYSVLTCLTKYPVEDFEDFCAEFGYDTDSISALKTYEAVKNEWLNVCALFDEEELEQFQEIQ